MGFKMRGLFKTTNRHRKYWKNRKIDWATAYGNFDHPHRQLIVNALQQFLPFRSVLELGCASGANLVRIKQAYPFSDVGGLDWNADAIETAKKFLPQAGVLQVGEATDVYISSGGADVVLTDMCYIYLGPKDFLQAIREARRVARKGVIFCEFHEPKWWKRVAIKWTAGYNAHDYRKSLEKIGFHDINIVKLTPQDWPETEKENGLRAIITARP